MNLFIRNARIIDPSQQLDRIGSLLLSAGKVAAFDVDQPDDAEIIDATDLIVTPGWIDPAVELREPGLEEDETIATGSAAALAGGFTTIGCLANTDPPIDSQAGVEFALHQARRASACHVVVISCVSKERKGEQLAELGLLAQAGAVAFSDAPSPISNPDLMRRALQYCRMFDLPILNRPEVSELSEGGIMHDGLVSTVLGLPGLPPAAEDVMTGRDLRLAEATGGRLHLLSISTAGSVEQLRHARSRGSRVTASVTIGNLVTTDDVLRSFDPNWKVKPPFRAQHHVNACLEGLRDGTIDMITSGHSPRASEKKMRELDLAPFGAIGLETMLPLAITHLIEPGHVSWPTLIEKVTIRPAQLLGQHNKGTLRIGADADVTVIDPLHEWTIDPGRFHSRSKNCPYQGQVVRGKATTIVAGRIRHDSRAQVA
jgi:dihydroorotase